MKLKGTQLIIMTAAVLCIFSLPIMAASTISVEPAYTEVWQGDEFTVNITVDSAEIGVYGASYILYFNNTLLNATSLEKGPFLAQDGNPSSIQVPPTEINNMVGEIKYGECKIGMVPGVTGYGVLTTITFQVIGEEGISPLNLGDLDGETLFGISGSIPTTLNNGRVMIGQSDVNGDGEINSADAAVALQMAVCGEYNTIADVNQDNSITSLDALMILQVAEEL
jgi:hypothetical protein